jgi:hypothetical protein
MEYKPGLFIAAKFSPDSENVLHDYARSLGLDPIPRDKLHVTIMYSTVDATEPFPFLEGKLAVPVAGKKLVYIGNAIAITLYSPWLQWRRDLAIACGLRSKFGSYLCHASIAYNPPKTLILPEMPDPPTDLVIVSEYSQAPN